MSQLTSQDSITDKVQAILARALDAISAAKNLQEIEALRIQYLGKKGCLTDLLKELKALPLTIRPMVGKEVNNVKDMLQDKIKNQIEYFKTQVLTEQLQAQAIDISLPGRGMNLGTVHPITRIRQRLEKLFLSMGFEVIEGPEIENDYYNFEALNIPANHPARAMHDTFYFANGLLLRTHTSPVQIRTLELRQPPLRVITPGRVFRCDYDQTHTPMFHQLEGLVVGKNVSFADLKGLIYDFLTVFFEKTVTLRFRPSFFPFTEPSAEVDIQQGDSWLEVLGCGMVHPQVLRTVNIDPECYSGFAFGMGIDRLAMLRYGVDDLRTFFENDLRFLNQF